MSIKNNTSSLQEILETINSLPNAGGGIELPELTNPAQASEIFLNKETIDEEGNIKVGIFTIDSELNTQNQLLTELENILNTKAVGGEQATPEISVNSSGLITATAGTKSATKQLAFQAAKTITPSTTSQIAVSSGYYTGGNITVAAVPTQTKSITPTSTTQNITPDSGKFLSKVTITGDSNLVASNIKSGVSIFGVNGTLEEGSGSVEASEWSENEDAIVGRTLTSYTNDRIKSIGSYAFASCTSLTTVSFPACTSIGNYAFRYCSSLATISFPACTSIGNYAFDGCTSLTTISFPACICISTYAFSSCSFLTTISFPACTSIGSYAFNSCRSLITVSFPVCTSISNHAFAYCRSLTTALFPACKTISIYAFTSCNSLTTISFPACTNIDRNAFLYCFRISNIQLGASSVCKLINSNAFSSTPFAGYSASFSGTPYIYVPASLVNAYKSATNWTYFSSYISAIEDMEV